MTRALVEVYSSSQIFQHPGPRTLNPYRAFDGTRSRFRIFEETWQIPHFRSRLQKHVTKTDTPLCNCTKPHEALSKQKKYQTLRQPQRPWPPNLLPDQLRPQLPSLARLLYKGFLKRAPLKVAVSLTAWML